MMKQGLPVITGNILFKYFFPIYNFLYFLYKKHKDRDNIVFLSEKIKQGMTVLDIGANIGFYTALFSKLVGKNGRVHAFEPDEKNYNRLKANTEKLANVYPVKCAVGKESGNARLYFSDELNTRHQTFNSGEGRRSDNISRTSIDDYFKKGEKVDFIKIDVEGDDYSAFLGMKKTIERSPDAVIFGELWPYGLKRSGAGPREYLDSLKEMGYRVKFFDKVTESDLAVKTGNRSFSTTFFADRGSK